MGYRVGVDIGGTFADFCIFDEGSGQIRTMKVLSTPDAPGQEVIAGLKALQERFGISPAEISYFTHGTTVGINALIMRKGIRLCLFATENFVDVLELARLKMPDPYHLLSARPEPLVVRSLVEPVRERMLSDGSVDIPLDRDSVAQALARAQKAGAQGIVISLLNAYRNPAHELAAAQLVAELAPAMHVFCSHRIRPIIREYERTSTAVIHAYVQPAVAGYLDALQDALAGIGVSTQAMITKSNGGVMLAELGKTACVETLLSGTAAGVMGASFIARNAGFPRVLSLDIGGTSADVAIIQDGMPGFGNAEVVGDFPVYVPSVAVTSIGDGGGSIAWLDAADILCVGPESAGSTPGPAAYGRGGTRPTITDAFVALGLLDVGTLGYGMVRIDRDAAKTAIAPLAKRLGLGISETAQGIIDVAVSGMYREISKLCSRRGIDATEFSLLPFGGGGPMMACFLARDLGIDQVVIPPVPGVLSALGGLTADIRNDFTAAAYFDLDFESLPELQRILAGLEERALSWITRDQKHAGIPALSPFAEMRYRGQSFEIEVPLQMYWIKNGSISAIAGAFNDAHRQLYGHADAAAPIQIIAVNMVITGHSPKPVLPRLPLVAQVARPLRQMPAMLDGTEQQVNLFQREDLSPGTTFDCPCVITQNDTTTIVPNGFRGHVDAFDNMILTRDVTHAN